MFLFGESSQVLVFGAFDLAPVGRGDTGIKRSREATARDADSPTPPRR
jgi:hypothetical protein